VGAALSLLSERFFLLDIPFPRELAEARFDASPVFRIGDCSECAGVSFSDLQRKFATHAKMYDVIEKEKFSLQHNLLAGFSEAFFSRLSELLANKDTEGVLALVGEVRHYASKLTLFALEAGLERFKEKVGDDPLSKYAQAALTESLSGETGESLRVFLDCLMDDIALALPEHKKTTLALVRRLMTTEA
jgi:hypothetical protein